jgi:hypothetical protein
MFNVAKTAFLLVVRAATDRIMRTSITKYHKNTLDNIYLVPMNTTPFYCMGTGFLMLLSTSIFPFNLRYWDRPLI